MTSIVLRWVRAEAPDGLEQNPSMGWGWRSDERPNVSSTYQLSLTRTRIILHIFIPPATTHRPPINHPEMLGLHNAQRPGDVIAEVWGKRVVAHH